LSCGDTRVWLAFEVRRIDCRTCGKVKTGIRLAVMDMWKPFRTATQTHAPQAAILFDKLTGYAVEKHFISWRTWARRSTPCASQSTPA